LRSTFDFQIKAEGGKHGRLGQSINLSKKDLQEKMPEESAVQTLQSGVDSLKEKPSKRDKNDTSSIHFLLLWWKATQCLWKMANCALLLWDSVCLQDYTIPH